MSIIDSFVGCIFTVFPLSVDPGPQGDLSDGGTHMLLVLFGIFMATALYMMRPRSLRAGGSTTGKPAPGSQVCIVSPCRP